jgi:hypothetical protein
MPEGFVPLQLAIAPSPIAGGVDEDDCAAGAASQTDASIEADVPATAAPEPDAAEAAADVRRFRAALADALDAQLSDLLGDIACDVLARELLLAPADVAQIVATALERFSAETPLRVRAHPADLPVLANAGVVALADASLRRGDAIVELQHGTIDARLGMRLAAVLEPR